MGGSFKIGRFSGIDVRVHWTFLLLLAFFAFLGYQASGTLAGAFTPISVIVALFICVVRTERLRWSAKGSLRAALESRM